ncbi:pentatricopeptide repeat (PPR-like) superfamily protein [Actinidia rufa]|uniref:Pentatricopeptide repeat (PPR-like) superfamily protein n=1 Tax=Actinidia rufa TaxID=165716 RepID=A0A7J0GBQ8_9ERIC|nr:pentatricopeptide repeat (PPR-like) superfamily protein [Actinidia rufa]
MAVPTSPDWSLASVNYCKKPTTTTTTTTFNSTSHFLSFVSLPCRNLRFFIPNSTNCSSPILEDTSTKPIPPELDSKIQNFQQFSEPETEDLNGFISTLFEDPQTEELAHKYYEKAKQNPEFRPEKSTLKQLIRYSIRSNNWSSILSICEDFRNFHGSPDSFTSSRLVVMAFDSAMKGYNKLHMYSSTIAVYGLMTSAEIALDPKCYSRVMEAYMKTGKIYQILCETLGKSGHAFEALEFFRDMTKKGIPQDHTMYSSLICSFASIREVKVAEDLFREAESKKMLRDPAVFLKLVLMYVKEGLLEKTLEIVSTMKRVKIRVSDCILCAIVNGFSKRRGLRAAAKVYEEMILRGCEPGQVTYASIISVYYRLGFYLQAEKVFSEMETKGFDRCIVAYSNMVAMYGKASKPGKAMRLVAKMKERGCAPNVWIYNSLLDMHGRALNLRQVEKTWKEMKRRKILPDKVSYTSVISAYSKAREFETCMRYYDEFRINGGVIDRAMAGIMVGVFSKMSQIDELVKLLQDMKTEGTCLDERLYRSAFECFEGCWAASSSKMVAAELWSHLITFTYREIPTVELLKALSSLSNHACPGSPLPLFHEY